MFLNKEKITLLVAVFALLITCYFSFDGFGAIQLEVPEFQSPVGSSDLGMSDEIVIAWWKSDSSASAEDSKIRDPFVAISDWRIANPDPLPLPPLEKLRRQVPLPQPLAYISNCRLPLEDQAPEALEEEDESMSNGGSQ